MALSLQSGYIKSKLISGTPYQTPLIHTQITYEDKITTNSHTNKHTYIQHSIPYILLQQTAVPKTLQGVADIVVIKDVTSPASLLLRRPVFEPQLACCGNENVPCTAVGGDI